MRAAKVDTASGREQWTSNGNGRARVWSTAPVFASLPSVRPDRPPTEVTLSKDRSKRKRRRQPLSPAARFTARSAFYIHLWVGVIATILVVSLSVTGVLLNHKKTLGYQPDADNPTATALSASLPLAELEASARAAAPELLDTPVDRMDVRPDDGLVKVRFSDPGNREIILALEDGRVLSNDVREDVFLEKLHSGELFGEYGVFLSDLAAVGLLLLILSGFWLWLFPRWRH